MTANAVGRRFTNLKGQLRTVEVQDGEQAACNIRLDAPDWRAGNADTGCHKFAKKLIFGGLSSHLDVIDADRGKELSDGATEERRWGGATKSQR